MILHILATAATAILASPLVAHVALDIADGTHARIWAPRVAAIAILVSMILAGIWA